MEIFLLLVALGFVWWLVKRRDNGRESNEKARERAREITQAAKRERLAEWETSFEDDTGILTVTIDFPSMRLTSVFEGRDGYSEIDHATEHVIRRRDVGWQMRHTEASRRAESDRLGAKYVELSERMGDFKKASPDDHKLDPAPIRGQSVYAASFSLLIS